MDVDGGVGGSGRGGRDGAVMVLISGRVAVDVLGTSAVIATPATVETSFVSGDGNLTKVYLGPVGG